jgi:hypothetical protein
MKRRIGSLTEKIVAHRQWPPVRLRLITAYTKSTAVVFFFAALAAAMAILPANARAQYGAQQGTSFSDTTGEHVFYLSQNNHVNELNWPATGSPSNASNWSILDLTSQTNAPSAYPLVNYGTAITSFNDMLGEHVFYLGSNSHIYQLFRPWFGSWSYQDLTATSCATNAAYSPTASFSDIAGEHVFYTSSNSDIYQLYLPWGSVGNSGCASWENQNLTTSAAGLLADTVNLAAFADQEGEYVFYTNKGNVRYLYWAWKGSSNWADVQGPSGAPLSTYFPMTAFWDNWGEHAIYSGIVGSATNIIQLYRTFGGQWGFQNLTDMNGGHPANSATPLTSFTDVMGESVYYVDTNNHLNQLFAESDWGNTDLTQITGDPTNPYPACTGYLTSFSDETGDHVFYSAFDAIVAGEADVHQLYRNGSSTGWTDVNLTANLSASQLLPTICELE